MALTKERIPQKVKVEVEELKSQEYPEQKGLLKRELVIRLQHLRSVAREAASAYLSNLEHRILEVIDYLNAAGNNGKSYKLKPGTMKTMMKTVDKLKLKPEKGRRKDLKRIERAVLSISGTLLKKKN